MGYIRVLVEVFPEFCDVFMIANTVQGFLSFKKHILESYR